MVFLNNAYKIINRQTLQNSNTNLKTLKENKLAQENKSL